MTVALTLTCFVFLWMDTKVSRVYRLGVYMCLLCVTFIFYHIK